LGRFTGAGSASGAGISFPPATIILFGGVGATPPAGWLLCDGASLLRTTFPALFTAIGTLYGSVDGTHFNLPKFDDNRKARGAVNDAARGTTGGVNSITQTIAQMPAHTHGIPSGNADSGSLANARFSNLIDTRITSTSVGSGDSMENQSLFVDVNYLIHV